MKIVTTTLLLLFACGPAVAEQDQLDGDLAFAGDGLIHEINRGLWPEHLSPPAERFWEKISNAEGDLKLFTEPLSAVQKRFGGNRQVYDYSGYHHEWLCYVAAGQRVWYLEEHDLVDWVVAEPSNPATDKDYGCVDQPLAALTSDTFPSIGATLEELAVRFDQPLEPHTDRVVFFSQLDDDISRTRTVYYRLKDGVVDGVSFSDGPGY
jgi:hypothetical protein